MSLPPLPQFTNEYQGEKLRYLVQVLENALLDFSSVDILAQKIPVVYPQFNTIGNLNNIETTLYTGNVTISQPYKFGWQIKVQAFGTFASNANAKDIKLYLNNVVIYNSTALVVNGGTWSVEALIVVSGAAAQQILITTISSNGSFPTTTLYSAGTITMNTTNTITLTATGVSSNDIIGQSMILTTQPN